MSLTSEEAVSIAKAHGLTLTDAASLQKLATTPEEAATLARQFTEPTQVSRDELKTMSSDEILAAKEAGRLQGLMEPNKGEGK